MKRLHLSSALQFLTSLRGGDIFSHFTANEDGERLKNVFLLCQFLFFASRSRGPILENINLDSLRMLMRVCATHIRRGRAASYERRRLVCKCAAAHRAGWSRLWLASAPLTRGLHVLGRVVPACLHTRTAMNQREDFFRFV